MTWSLNLTVVISNKIWYFGKGWTFKLYNLKFLGYFNSINLALRYQRSKYFFMLYFIVMNSFKIFVFFFIVVMSLMYSFDFFCFLYVLWLWFLFLFFLWYQGSLAPTKKSDWTPSKIDKWLGNWPTRVKFIRLFNYVFFFCKHIKIQHSEMLRSRAWRGWKNAWRMLIF